MIFSHKKSTGLVSFFSFPWGSGGLQGTLFFPSYCPTSQDGTNAPFVPSSRQPAEELFSKGRAPWRLFFQKKGPVPLSPKLSNWQTPDPLPLFRLAKPTSFHATPKPRLPLIGGSTPVYRSSSYYTTFPSKDGPFFYGAIVSQELLFFSRKFNPPFLFPSGKQQPTFPPPRALSRQRSDLCLPLFPFARAFSL